MGCKSCVECILKLLNFILTLMGLAMMGYGIYLFVLYNKSSSLSSSDDGSLSIPSSVTMFSRPMLIGVSLSTSFLDNLLKAWFICVFIGVGLILFIVSCFGCIGASTRNRCCLTCYAVLVLLLILVQLGCAAFMFFDKSWIDEIPTDKTGDFDMIYEFVDENWGIFKWVVIGYVIFEVVLFILAIIVRWVNRPAEYDSDDEYIGGGRLPAALATTGVPVTTASHDQRPSRIDAWSTRMKEKYGLDTSAFTYNPADPNRTQPATGPPQAAEDKKCCAIM